MKEKFIKIIISLLTLVTISFTALSGCDDNSSDKVYEELGIPLMERYITGEHARCPWDVKVFNNEVFVGSGDYTLYSGPASIYAYDLTTREWNSKGSVRDAQVARFMVFDGVLTLPGIDPMASWDVGSYYQFNGESWDSYSKIPNGIHNFDMVQFDGKIFAGLGVNPGNNSVVVSSDGGETFDFVPFMKNDELIDTSTCLLVRTYELIVLKEELYAVLYLQNQDESRTVEVYKYENEKLNYISDFTSLSLSNRVSDNLFSEKKEFSDGVLFVTDYLYYTQDMLTYSKIQLPKDEFVSDLLIDDEEVYILSYKKTGAEYETVIYRLNQSGIIKKIKSFNYPVMPISFDKYENNLFIGMGDKNNVHDKNGMILSVKV